MALKTFLCVKDVSALLPTGLDKVFVEHCSSPRGVDMHIMLPLHLSEASSCCYAQWIVKHLIGQLWMWLTEGPSIHLPSLFLKVCFFPNIFFGLLLNGYMKEIRFRKRSIRCVMLDPPGFPLPNLTSKTSSWTGRILLVIYVPNCMVETPN